jgi:hypothetical protein
VSIDKLGREWQSRLRLNDWTISFRHGTPEEIEGAFGSSTWVLHKRYAEILILPEAQRVGMVPYESEQETIKHELMHLHFAPLDTGEQLNRMVIEHAIDAIVRSYEPLCKIVHFTQVV